MHIQWADIENTLAASSGLLAKRSEAIFARTLSMNKNKSILSENTADIFSRYAAMQYMTLEFFSLLYKNDHMGDIFILCCSGQPHKNAKDVTLRSNIADSPLFFGDFNFKKSGQRNLALVDDVHRHIIIDPYNKKPLLPQDRLENLETASIMYDKIYNGTISPDTLELYEHIAAFNTAHTLLSALEVEESVPKRAMLQSQLSIPEHFFRQFDLQAVKHKIYFPDKATMNNTLNWTKRKYVEPHCMVSNNMPKYKLS